MKLNRFSVSLFVASAIATAAHAAPSVTQSSGTFAAGSSVTITGSSFGTKNSSGPLVYDNFEAGTVGSKVMTAKAVVGQWQNGAGYDVPVYTSEQVHAGSKAVKLSAKGGVYNMSLNQNGSFPVVYMDWWVRVHQYDNPSRNWKPWRLYGANDTLQTNAVIMCNGSGTSVENGGGGGGFWWDSMPFANNVWQHYQVMLKASSSPGSADGVLKQYLDGKLISNHTGIVTRSGSEQWNQIRVGHYWASDGVPECGANSGADIYIDNLYIDTNWAHVELGNASTYSASTQREIQVPTAWSNGSITFSVNPGAFKAGTTAYLYVMDSSGNVNANGIPVSIGGSATPAAAPMPPANVKVQ
jgi:hypothetical protein